MIATTMPINLLFLCTGNSARSLIAEGVLRQLGGRAFNAFSAGSHPTGKPNPHAIAVLRQHDIDTGFARSKSWDEFASADATQLDLIITVCDNAAGETCPIWPGRPATAHWGLPDPAAVDGPQQAITAAFLDTYDELVQRIRYLLDHYPGAANIAELAKQMASYEVN